MNSLETLRALHAAIGTAIDDIGRIYCDEGLEYPSLDIPFYSGLETDPRRSNAEKLRTHPAVAKAASLAVAAAGHIVATLQPPLLSVVETTHFAHITACLGILEATHTAEILRDSGPGGMHVNDLARKVEEVRFGKDAVADVDLEHLDPVKFGHVLRLLVTSHWLRETSPSVFAANRLTSAVDSGKTLDLLRESPEKKYDETDGAAALVAMTTNEHSRSVTYLSQWLLPSIDKTRKPKSPFDLAYNMAIDEGYYDFLERPENSLRLIQASRAMSIARGTEAGLTISNESVFPWDSLPKDSAVIDVGGGIGSVAIQLAEAYPDLRLVVQDRPQTFALAKQIWGPKYKDLFDSGHVSFQGQDFFEPQPTMLRVPGVGAVTHPATYVVTRVLHNWPDAANIKILKNLRAAAGSDTKLILNEIILPLACDPPFGTGSEDPVSLGTLVPPGSPLLPNLGKAGLVAYQLDINMMTLLDSREHTLEEFRAITREGGWEIASVRRSSSAMGWGYIVATPI